MSSEKEFDEKITSKTLAQVFRVYNCKSSSTARSIQIPDISLIRLVCKTWKSFTENPIFIHESSHQFFCILVHQIDLTKTRDYSLLKETLTEIIRCGLLYLFKPIVDLYSSQKEELELTMSNSSKWLFQVKILQELVRLTDLNLTTPALYRKKCIDALMDILTDYTTRIGFLPWTSIVTRYFQIEVLPEYYVTVTRSDYEYYMGFLNTKNYDNHITRVDTVCMDSNMTMGYLTYCNIQLNRRKTAALLLKNISTLDISMAKPNFKSMYPLVKDIVEKKLDEDGTCLMNELCKHVNWKIVTYEALIFCGVATDFYKSLFKTILDVRYKQDPQGMSIQELEDLFRLIIKNSMDSEFVNMIYKFNNENLCSLMNSEPIVLEIFMALPTLMKSDLGYKLFSLVSDPLKTFHYLARIMDKLEFIPKNELKSYIMEREKLILDKIVRVYPKFYEPWTVCLLEKLSSNPKSLNEFVTERFLGQDFEKKSDFQKIVTKYARKINKTPHTPSPSPVIIVEPENGPGRPLSDFYEFYHYVGGSLRKTELENNHKAMISMKHYYEMISLDGGNSVNCIFVKTDYISYPFVIEEHDKAYSSLFSKNKRQIENFSSTSSTAIKKRNVDIGPSMKKSTIILQHESGCEDNYFGDADADEQEPESEDLMQQDQEELEEIEYRTVSPKRFGRVDGYKRIQKIHYD